MKKQECIRAGTKRPRRKSVSKEKKAWLGARSNQAPTGAGSAVNPEKSGKAGKVRPTGRTGRARGNGAATHPPLPYW